MALIHGGQLQKQIEKYQIPVEKWLDLSTGISLTSYPIPEIPQSVWQQLPQPQASLITAARSYYGTQDIMATSGSQAVIKQLPQIFTTHLAELNNEFKPQQVDVWLPRVGYKEHEKAWRDNAFNVKQYNELPSAAELTPHCIIVVINPNNPTGRLYTRVEMQALLKQVESHQGWLIVDEAFMDVITPNESIISETHNRHLLVLRSVGKFFGLAGIRIGFVSAHPDWLQAFALLSSPWEVNGPAQFITERALLDTDWQQQQQALLSELTQQTKALLAKHFQQTSVGTNLFQTVKLDNAPAIYEQLCQQGVYVRLCDEQDALRFGISDEVGLARLAKVFFNHKLFDRDKIMIHWEKEIDRIHKLEEQLGIAQEVVSAYSGVEELKTDYESVIKECNHILTTKNKWFIN